MTVRTAPETTTPTTTPTTQEPEPPFEAAVALPRALQAAGSVAAPTGLLTGLFFYFGLLYAVAYYRHFGINYSVLQLPFTGVLILSASTAIVPLAVLAGSAWVVLRVYRIPLEPSPAVRRWLVGGVLPAVAVTGTLLVLLTVADLAGADVFGTVWEGRGVSLSLGIVLLGYAARLRRALLPVRPTGGRPKGAPLVLTVANWVCLCTLFGIGLFWAVGSYALRVGEQDAQRFTADLACGPDVVVYSETDLHLGADDVLAERLPGADEGFAFRYSGLKLVPQPGEMYLLVPSDWAPDQRPAILLPRSAGLRLEFVTVTGSRPADC